MGAHPRAAGLETAAVDAPDTTATSALSLLPQTHETARLAAPGTSVLTHMSSLRPRHHARSKIGARVHGTLLPDPITESPLSLLPYLQRPSARFGRLSPRPDRSLPRRWIQSPAASSSRGSA